MCVLQICEYVCECSCVCNSRMVQSCLLSVSLVVHDDSACVCDIKLWLFAVNVTKCALHIEVQVVHNNLNRILMQQSCVNGKSWLPSGVCCVLTTCLHSDIQTSHQGCSNEPEQEKAFNWHSS